MASNMYQYPSSVAAQAHAPYQQQTEYISGNSFEETSPEGSTILNNEGQTIKEPYKIKSHNKQNSLSSMEINKQSLRSIEEVLKENIHLHTESCAGTLCQRLAKEAIFGEDIMKRCTPYGTQESPGLPRDELYTLKKIMFEQFPRFHSCPHLFEDVWKKCIGSIEQACRRIRLKEKRTKWVCIIYTYVTISWPHVYECMYVAMYTCTLTISCNEYVYTYMLRHRICNCYIAIFI